MSHMPLAFTGIAEINSCGPWEDARGSSRRQRHGPGGRVVAERCPPLVGQRTCLFFFNVFLIFFLSLHCAACGILVP